MVPESTISTLLVIPYYVIGLALLAGLFRFPVLTPVQRLIFLLIVITALVEIASRILWVYKINNLPLFHFFALAEFYLLCRVYRRALSGLPPIYFDTATALFFLFALWNMWYQGLKAFNSHALTLSAVFFILLSILYFYQLLKKVEYERLEKNPMFWINSGVLVYFASSLVLFHLSNRLLTEAQYANGLAWGVHAIFNVFHYLSFTIALWIRPGP
ncbi:hypothetical protein AB9P05_19885 [Roseivirga sp. BDSF3-8]|uniref:hypothetical protein n=1 Tax=Roseivirga sp. BDSF3-8 TaxID=3241598 RepID=UPI003531B483